MSLSYAQHTICRRACLAVSVLGFLCYCLAFVLPYWAASRTDGHVVRYGLLSVCIVTARREACGAVRPVSGNEMFIAAQAFGIIAFVGYFVSTVSCGMTLCWPYKWTRYLLLVSSGAAVVTTFCGALMTTLYVIYHWTSSFQFGLYMATAGLCATPFISVAALVLGRRIPKPITKERKSSIEDGYFDPIFVTRSQIAVTPRSSPSTSREVVTSRIARKSQVRSWNKNIRTTSHGNSEQRPNTSRLTPSDIRPMFKHARL